MWVYNQSNGMLLNPDGVLVAWGYSGRGLGRNNATMVAVHDQGPIPVGKYTMRPPEDTTTHGPYVLWLLADPTNEMYNRSGFGIHGDRKEGEPGMASEGCIVLPLAVRKMIWRSSDHVLEVVSGERPQQEKA